MKVLCKMQGHWQQTMGAIPQAVEHDNEWGIIFALFGDVEFDTVAGDTTVSNVRKVAGNSHDRYALKNSVRIIEG